MLEFLMLFSMRIIESLKLIISIPFIAIFIILGEIIGQLKFIWSKKGYNYFMNK